ncbi:ABC transporter ATP-binding protein [Candidatus Daviesbacteria bacterium]|nr:ABC transporter ATP-binding protein [Candidatus Daviesbacteria bacterium]
MVDIIQVKNLVKRYKKADKNAVDDISFSVAEGEFFTFLGPNGAGKTTTISILTTTLSKTSGEVNIAGFDVDKDSSKVRQNVGIIFQNPSLDANLTAEENIRFHAILYGLYPFRPTFSLMPEDYKSRINELAQVLGIEKDLFKAIKTYSGGMKRKLEIVRSLIHKPKVLFLDEPTVGLDPASRKSLWEYLVSVRKQDKTTIFLTTHYLDEAEDADRVCIINHGKIVKLGSPTQIKKELTKEYIILDSKDRNKLKSELVKMKLKFIENADIKVEVDSKNVQKIIQGIKVPLSVLRINSPSLEDAYLKIIEVGKEELGG